MCNAKGYVRSTPESGHVQRTYACPLSANSGLMRCSKWVAYSIISSARCDVTLLNHPPGIGIISITSTVAFGMVKCGLSAKRAAAAS